MQRTRALALLAAVALLPSEAAAFSAQGHHWDQASLPVSYRIHPAGVPGIDDGSDLQAVRNAFETWQSVSCSLLTFREDAWVEPPLVANDQTHRIFWINDAALWPADQRTTIALTFTFYRTSDQIITDADIINNAVNYQWTTVDGQAGGTRVDVETILFHEIGHFFGLDHSQDPAAAMFPSNNKIKQREPTSDDINGICSLYSNGQTPPPPGGGDGGGVGAPCQNNTNCASSLCVEDSQLNTAYCTQPCSVMQSGSCPAGYQCTNTSSGELCLPPVITEELCDQCSSSQQCSTGLCLDVPNYNFFQPFCTRACDPTAGVPGACPNGYQCVPVSHLGQNGGVCAPTTGVCNPAGKGGHGEPCYANGGCKPQHVCVDYWGDGTQNFCYFECNVQLAGSSCSETAPVVCLRLDRPGLENRAACINIAFAGQPCLPEQCDPRSICLFDETVGMSSALCYAYCPDTGCPANTQCQNVGGGLQVCVPNAGFKPLGASCSSDEECSDRSCRVYGDDQLCTQRCTTTDALSCPDAFRCIPGATGGTEGLCWPTGLIDRTATDPNRGILERLPPGFCVCDTTSQCDRNCDCDPECEGGCSCSVSKSAGPAGIATMIGFLAVAFLLRRRR